MADPLRPLDTDEANDAKLRTIHACGDMIRQRGWAFYVTVGHLGTLFGRWLQQGYAPADCERLTVDQCTAWFNGLPDVPEMATIAHVGNDQVLELMLRDPNPANVHALPTDGPDGTVRPPLTDEGGIIDLGVQFGARIQAGYESRRSFRECGTWLVQWYGGDNPWFKPPVLGPHPDPIVGTIRASWEEGISDATGHRLLVVAHAGDLLARNYRDQATVDDHLNAMAARGYHGVRTWTVLYGTYWANFTGEIHADMPGYWDTVRDFARELVSRKLRWMVSQGDLMRWANRTQVRRDFMRQLALVLREEGGTDSLVMAVDAGNETIWNGEDNPQALKDALDAFLQVLPVPFATLTSWDDEHPFDYWMPGLQRDNHSSRGPWPMPPRRVFNGGYEPHPRIYVSQSEGPGQGVQEYGGDRRIGHHVSATDRPNEWNDNNPETVGVQAMAHVIGKGLYVYFCSPGVVSDEPFTNYTAFDVVPQLFRRMPRTVQSWGIFHGGNGRPFSPDRVLGVPDNDDLQVRCDHAAGPYGERVCLAYGPPGSYSLPVINNFQGHVIHPGTLEETAVTWRRGERVRLDWHRGRVIHGFIS